MNSRFRVLLTGLVMACVFAAVSCGKKQEPAASQAQGDSKVIQPTRVSGPAPESMKQRALVKEGEGAAPDGPFSEGPERVKLKEERKKKKSGQNTGPRAVKKAKKRAERDAQAEKAQADAEKAAHSLPAKPEGEYKNVLLITIDTTRADRMSCYGAARVTTPTIDAVAKEGTVFENAFAQRNSTWPTLATIMTSQYPVQHGVRSNGLRIGNEALTLAEYLSQHGYLCAAVYANATAQNWEGFQFRFPCDIDPVDERATHHAVKWIEEYKDYKFFMWLHYLAPHADYMPPQEFRTFVDPNYTGPIDGSKESITDLTLKRIEPTDTNLKQVMDLYDGELLYVDNEIKKVLDTIKSSGLYDKTLIIVSADHGEELHSHHGYFGHGASMYDTVLRVPLIVRMPGVVPADKRDATLVQHMNIAPTVCEVVGLPAPDAFVGKSLVPLFKGEKVDYGPSIAEMQDEILTIRTADYKYIANPLNYKPRKLNEERRQDAGIASAKKKGKGQRDVESEAEPEGADFDPALLEMQMKDEELYHVAEDRGEQKDIAKDNPDMAKAMREKLKEFQEKYNWTFGHSVSDRVQKEVDPELKSKLEAMGYVL